MLEESGRGRFMRMPTEYYFVRQDYLQRIMDNELTKYTA